MVRNIWQSSKALLKDTSRQRPDAKTQVRVLGHSGPWVLGYLGTQVLRYSGTLMLFGFTQMVFRQFTSQQKPADFHSLLL